MKYTTLLLATLLAGCGGGVVVEEKPITVKVPVTVPCVAGPRPEGVVPLKQAHPNWYSYTPKQKTELAAAQALKHQSYGQEINAATSACK